MQATFKLNNATFRVRFRSLDQEFTGDCFWEIKRKQLADVWEQGEFLTDYFDNPNEWQEFGEDDDPDEIINIYGADSLICFAAAASQCKPAEYHIDYYGEPYWFFHDMVHAEYDSGDGTNLYIDQDSEELALPLGAKIAAEHDVPIGDILRELVKATSEFEERFGTKFDAVQAFVDSVELTIKT